MRMSGFARQVTRSPQALAAHLFERKHLHSHKLLNIFVVYAMLLSMILGVVQPAHAAPTAGAPAAAPASTDAILRTVDVGAPAINKIFDVDGIITVSDLADHFVPPFSVGDAFLQSRTWPIGEPGTQGQGLYAYLYRVDLRGAIGTTAISCVTNLEIDFGPVASLDYNLDGKAEEVFVVTSGGLGSSTVVSPTQTGTVVNFRFNPSVCGGATRNGGDSSFFFGMASKDPEQVVPAKLTGTAGLNVTLKAKAPRQGTVRTEPGCYEIKHPSEIPSPALIDFDDLADAKEIGESYFPAYGVKFHDDKDTSVITYADRESDPTKARSTPNVAINNAVFPATSENVPLTFHFDSGKTHVGFYMGNGETAGLAGAMVGYDAAGNVICQITNTPVPEAYDEFIGMYDPAGRIMSITLNYGATLLSEAIDDLYFAPGKSGIGAAPTEPLFGGGSGVRTAILKSDNESFSAEFYFPSLQLNPVHAPDAREYVQALLPGVDPNTSGNAGDPDLPIFRTMIAAPEGAVVRVAEAKVEYGEPTQGLLLPAQPSPADVAAMQDDEMPDDKAFMDLPFERNDATYRSGEPWPAQPVDVVYMGKARDLNLWQVSIASGQFTPNKGLLLPAVKVTLQLNFEGGKGGFLPEGRQNMPFDGNGDPNSPDGVNPMYAAALNAGELTRYVFADDLVLRPLCWGHEYIIITHPDFKAAADTLKAEKVAKGISTLVVETGAGAGKAGTTNTQIRDYIKGKYNTCLVRPSYLLLLGDSEFIPPFYRPTQYADLAGTDLDYSLMSGADILPDLAYGRIPVDTLGDANRVVNKIVSYEQAPPIAAQFYDDATLAAYFQCCRADTTNDGTDSRSFLETSEMVRNHLLGRGFDVERIYSTDTHYHDDPSAAGYYNETTRSTTPNRYYNGALLPAALRASSGYAWDGNSADVIDAINDGSFLVIHRDHGGPNGWVSPSFSSSNLASLSNGALTPVVYSINCASGLWDNETRDPADDAWNYGTNVNGSYWAERILRMEGGAVGVIGDTRNSPTWANSALLRGLIDASWPTLLPYGPGTAFKRQGDVLNHAKLYMASQVGVAQTAGSVSTDSVNTNITLYHVMGDPTLQMWTKDPWKIVLPKWFRFIEFNPLEWKLRYPVENVVITVLQGDNPVARGVVVNGIANLRLLGDGSVYDPKLPLDFSAQGEDGQFVKLAASTRTIIAVKGQDAQLGGPDTKFGLLLPAVAFNEDLTLVHQDVLDPTKPTPDGTTWVGGFELGAFAGDGSVRTAFDADWTATIDTGLLLPAVSAAGDGAAPDYQCMWLNETTNAWEPIASSVSGETLTCKANHFSEFAVVATPDVPAQDESIYLPLIGK